MAERQYRTLTKRTVDRLSVNGKDAVFRDTNFPASASECTPRARRLRDGKTGARAVPLSPAAKQVLTALPRRPDNPWVFPGRVTGSRLRTLNASWQVVRKEAQAGDSVDIDPDRAPWRARYVPSSASRPERWSTSPGAWSPGQGSPSRPRSS